MQSGKKGHQWVLKTLPTVELGVLPSVEYMLKGFVFIVQASNDLEKTKLLDSTFDFRAISV